MFQPMALFIITRVRSINYFGSVPSSTEDELVGVAQRPGEDRLEHTQTVIILSQDPDAMFSKGIAEINEVSK